LEAAGDGGEVQIGVNARESTAIIEITDNGAGMDDHFVRNHLFKPFRSTKERGFGIGAFQCREYAREIGGDLQVISSSGSGTTMRVVLPCSPVQDTHDPVRAAV
jgi:signal transduction histidine kinase